VRDDWVRRQRTLRALSANARNSRRFALARSRTIDELISRSRPWPCRNVQHVCPTRKRENARPALARSGESFGARNPRRPARVDHIDRGVSGRSTLRSSACAYRSRGPKQETLRRESTSACRGSARWALRFARACRGDRSRLRAGRSAGGQPANSRNHRGSALCPSSVQGVFIPAASWPRRSTAVL